MQHELPIFYFPRTSFIDVKETKDDWYGLHLRCRELRIAIFHHNVTLLIGTYLISPLRWQWIFTFKIHPLECVNFENLQLWSSASLQHPPCIEISMKDRFNVHVYTDTIYWTYNVSWNERFPRLVIQYMFNIYYQGTFGIYERMNSMYGLEPRLRHYIKMRTILYFDIAIPACIQYPT